MAERAESKVGEPTPRLPSYDCPHCGASDSTRCGIALYSRPGNGPEYSPKKLERGREVGCRVAFYVDLQNAKRVCSARHEEVMAKLMELRRGVIKAGVERDRYRDEVERLRQQNQRLREAISDALVDILPGYAPHAILTEALERAHRDD